MPSLSIALGVEVGSPRIVQSLDGSGWTLATDPKNVGREEKWFEAPRTNAVGTKVPWIIQDAFPGYHGVAWYWRDFVAPTNPHPQGRGLLRFWAVDYKAEGGSTANWSAATRTARRPLRIKCRSAIAKSAAIGPN